MNQLESEAMNKIHHQRSARGDGNAALPTGKMFSINLLALFQGIIMRMEYSLVTKTDTFARTDTTTWVHLGILAASTCFSASIAAIAWGYFCDKKGAKFSAIVCTIGLILATTALCFTTSSYLGLVTKFLQGFFFGSEVVSKVMIGDVCDDANVALGFAIYTTSVVIGVTIGPCLSCYFVLPGHRYLETFFAKSFCGKFPAILPVLIQVSGLTIAMILAVVYLPKDKEKNGESGRTVPDLEGRTYYTEDSSPTDESKCIVENSKASFENSPWSGEKCEYFVSSHIDEHLIFSIDHGSGPTDSKFSQVFKMKNAAIAISIYTALSFLLIGNFECLPQYIPATREYYGLYFSRSDVAILLFSVAASLLIFQLAILPKITGRYGSINVMIFAVLLMAIIMPLVPIFAGFQCRIAFWVALWLQLFAQRSLVVCCLCKATIFINTAVSRDLRGVANGVSMTSVNVARMIVPVIGAAFAPWSLLNAEYTSQLPPSFGFPYQEVIIQWCELAVIVLLTSNLQNITQPSK